MIIGSMLVAAAAAFATDTAGSVAHLSPVAQRFMERATERLLAGDGLPPDYRVHVLQMPPADRIAALIYLRRIGLLTDAGWSIDDLLKPSNSAEATE